MKTEEIKRQGYTMLYNVYEAGVDYDPSDEVITLRLLTRYNLHKGYGVWQIGATYAKHLRPSYYYVVATNRINAKQKFLSAMPWLSFVKSIVPMSDEDADTVLNNPAKFPLW